MIIYIIYIWLHIYIYDYIYMIIYTYIDVLDLIMLQGKGDCSTRKLTVNFGNFDQLAMCDVFFLKVACGYQPIWNYKTLWTRYWLGAYLKDYDRLCLMFMDCVAMLRWLTDSSILSMTNFHLARGMVELEFVEVGGGGKCWQHRDHQRIWADQRAGEEWGCAWFRQSCGTRKFRCNAFSSLFNLCPMCGQTQEFQNTVNWYLLVMSQSL